MKDIKDYEGLYAITSCGKVWSYKSKKFLKAVKGNGGYLRVCLCKDKIKKTFLIHRLVAEAYIPNPENFTDVDHIDGDKNHNYIGNLQWMTHIDNSRKSSNKKIRCIELDKIFESQTAAAEELGLCRPHISQVCNGKRKTCGGLHFEYVEVI